MRNRILKKLFIVMLALTLAVGVATPTHGASGRRLAQADSGALTAEKAGRLVGNYVGLRQLWLDLAADVYWDAGGSRRSDITALTGPFKTALEDVLADYFAGHVQTPPAISNTTIDAAALKAKRAAQAFLGFTPRTDRDEWRDGRYNELDKPHPSLRYTNWGTFYSTFLRTATEGWAKSDSFVARVERLRDLYTAMSEAWPASADRSALDNMFNGVGSAPGLGNDIKLNIGGPVWSSEGPLAPQVGRLVGQYINLRRYWNALMLSSDWDSAWSDVTTMARASAGVEKHLENVVTGYFRKNLQESGPASKARSAAQKALAITDPDGADVRGDIYDDLGGPWGRRGVRYAAWGNFYKGLSDAVKDDIPKTTFGEKMGRLLGLYTKHHKAWPKAGSTLLFKALANDIAAYMHKEGIVGPVSYVRSTGHGVWGTPPASVIAARLSYFVQGYRLQQLQNAFGTGLPKQGATTPRASWPEWHAFYDSFRETAG